jgi:hypothetical protein
MDNQVVRDYGVNCSYEKPIPIEGRNDKRIILNYGCYGLGTHAAAMYSKEPAFLKLVKNTEEDIECVVACDAVGSTPQGFVKSSSGATVRVSYAGQTSW